MEDEINLYEPVKCTNFTCFLGHYAHRKTTKSKLSIRYTGDRDTLSKYIDNVRKKLAHGDVIFQDPPQQGQ
jgi:hypothetical protein